jgi:hypothetical protein
MAVIPFGTVRFKGDTMSHDLGPHFIHWTPDMTV